MHIKYILLVSFFWSYSFVVEAQPYQPVGVEGAHWIIAAPDFGGNSSHHSLAIKGDTLIGGTEYYKLYYQELANSAFLEPPYLISNEYLWGVIRDDIDAREVHVISFEPYEFGYHCLQGEEVLLYDFSSNPGDTVGTCLTVEQYPWVVDSVSSANYFGEERRILHSSQPNNIPIIYEGLGGGSYGLLGALNEYVFTGYADLYLADYCIGTDDFCHFLITSTKSQPKSRLKLEVFPNPANSMASFSFATSTQEVFNLNLYSTLGDFQLSVQVPKNSREFTVDVTSLSPGIYFYVLSKLNGEIVASDELVVSRL